ncbi:unnamed protein product, partial [Ixodes pacificus]
FRYPSLCQWYDGVCGHVGTGSRGVIERGAKRLENCDYLGTLLNNKRATTKFRSIVLDVTSRCCMEPFPFICIF